MLRLALADLRESWLAWLSVSLTFIATSTCLTLSALGAASALAYDYPNDPSGEGRTVMAAAGFVNLVFCIVVGLFIVSASTGLVVRSRRGALARLALAGSSPGQVVGFMVTQLAVVSLACAVVGALIAIPLLPPSLDAVAGDRNTLTPPAVYPPDVLLTVAAVCVAVAVLGGLHQARVAGKLPPVEALREATSGGGGRRSRIALVLRALAVPAGAALIWALWRFVNLVVEDLHRTGGKTNDVGSMVMQVSLLTLIIAGVSLAVAAPVMVGPLARLLGVVVPIPDASWHLARQTVIAKSDRLVRSVTAVMFSVGLLCGMQGFGATMQASLDNALSGVKLEGISATSTLSMLLLPLVIATAGSVGNLVMMSRQRDAELALDGVIGATPGQQTMIPIFEAAIITLVASVLGVIMALVCTIFVYAGMDLVLGGKAVLEIPWAMMGVIVVACLLVGIAATLLPTLPSLRQPAPKVIARLVAE